MVETGDIERIRELLGEHKQGLTIDEVSRFLGINRSTASKYLNSLVYSGAATIRRLGPAKLFYLKEVIPLDQLLDHATEGVAVVDQGYAIQYINNTLARIFHCNRDQVIGFQVHDTPLHLLFTPETFHAIESIRDDSEREVSESITLDSTVWTVIKRIFPVNFKSGLRGTGIVCHFTETGSKSPAKAAGGGDKFSPLIKRSCLQQNQLNVLIRRYAKNQLALALDLLKKSKEERFSEKLSRISRGQEDLLQSLLLHLKTFDDFLGDEILRPDWYSLEDVLGAALSNIRLSHIRFFSDVKGYFICSNQGLPQVFQSLLENSILHGQKVTSIRVTARDTGEGLLIIYEDDGVGIPDTDKSLLFEWGREPHKAHSLFLCRQVLSITGISIKETGRQGRGARFEILVPPGRFRSSARDRT